MYTCKDNLTPLLYSGKIKKKIQIHRESTCSKDMSKMVHRIQVRLNAGTMYGKRKTQKELHIYYGYCLALSTLPFQYFEVQ